MRIRTANGQVLAGGRLWAVLVIIMVVIFGGHAFGQVLKPQSGSVRVSKNGKSLMQVGKKSGVELAPVVREISEPEMRINGDEIVPMYITEPAEVTAPREQPRLNLPIMLPVMNPPNAPNSQIPVVTPPGGGSGTPPPNCSTIRLVAACRCPLLVVPEKNTGLKMVRFNDAGVQDGYCPTPIIYRTSVMLTTYIGSQSYNSCEHKPTGSEICAAGAYDTWAADYTWIVDLGCDYPQFNKLVSEHGVGSPSGSFIFQKHDAAPHVVITPCRGDGQ